MDAITTDLRAVSWADLPAEKLAQLVAAHDDDDLDAILHDWRFVARPEQVAPTHREWITWLVLAGRGFGKTRTGAEWVREKVKEGFDQFGMIAPTTADVRDVMVEGPAGILAVCWDDDLDKNGNPIGAPLYEPSKRKITWANGAVAHLYSAEEPDRLRGPQHAALWCDELAAWTDAGATWDMAMFGLRLGKKPQVCVTTTPRPIPIIRELIRDPSTVVTGGSTYANRANLAPTFFDKIVRKYEGTRLGEQELNAQILDEAEGALWSRDMIVELPRPDGFDMKAHRQTFARIVVGVDPPASSRGENALCGIVVAGLKFDRTAEVLADYSIRGKPAEWGAKVVAAYDEFRADRIIAEGNQGGEMVSHTIETVRSGLPVSLVYAKLAKQARAEPVSALYEKKRVAHRGGFPELTDQMCTWEPLTGQASPDRLDALVWALTHLSIGLGGNVITSDEARYIIEPDKAWRNGRIPSTWARASAIDIDVSTFAALWSVRDPVNDVVYLYDEFVSPRPELSIGAEAVLKRGRWIPSLFDPKSHKRQEAEGVRIARHLNDLGVELSVTPVSIDAAIDELMTRIETGRLKVLSTMTNWLQAMRAFRRGDDGEIVDENTHLIRATALLVLYGEQVAITENRSTSDRDGFDAAAYQREENPTGY